MRYLFSFALLHLLAVAAYTQDKKTPPDHGRVLSTCIDVAPGKLKDTTNLSDTKNYVFRGRVISLGKDRKVSICYDTEHMRVAGAWLGAPMVYAADKNMGPAVDGDMIFSTKPGPGWAKDGKWDDPRVGREGPLPRDWAHYRGMYLHGDKVVLSYTVGDMEVLETPEHVDHPRFPVIGRILDVGPTTKEQKLRICDGDGAEIVKDAPIATLKRAGNQRVFVWSGGETRLEISDGHLVLILPVSAERRTYRVLTSVPFEYTLEEVRALYTVGLPYPKSYPREMQKGGPPRWTETLETTGTLGDSKAGPYTLDHIQLPEKNPWNASIRFGALDFFPDGRAALSTWDGDVWIVSGLDAALDPRGASPAAKLRWKRFAAGLHATLGLKIVNGIIHVAGRDQITKLHDLNNDGEADFYENINNEPGLTLQRHEFVMDLQTDKDGNFYFCRSGHYVQSKRGDNCVVYKMSPDGKKLEKLARGFREPNGMSIGPDGTMTVADNEGNGIPQTPLYRLLPGRDYGFTPSLTGNVNQGSFKLKEQPIVWLGPKIDTSAGGQVWVPRRAEPRKGPGSDTPGTRPLTGLGSPDWGPLTGQLLHTSYGNCALFSVLIDKQAEPWQGAVWKFPFTFTSGIMRASFHPIDGQLYVCGLRGWGTSAVKDGQFARIRYTGKHLPIPVGYRVVKNGIELTFSDPLDKTSAEDDDNWAGTWSAILKKVPSPKEKQDMPITSARLSADRKTVTIGLEKMRTVPNFTLQYRITAADGAPVSGELNGTIHRVP